MKAKVRCAVLLASTFLLSSPALADDAAPASRGQVVKAVATSLPATPVKPQAGGKDAAPEPAAKDLELAAAQRSKVENEDDDDDDDSAAIPKVRRNELNGKLRMGEW